MLTVKFVYDNEHDFAKFCAADLNGVFVEIYDEGSYKEKKQAYKLKSSCGARKTPFAAASLRDCAWRASATAQCQCARCSWCCR